MLGSTTGWLIKPPTSPEAESQLVRDSIAIAKGDLKQEKYHSLFLSHTGDDKPFVRQLRDDLLAHGVPRVWLDEDEIEIGDSHIEKIDEGMKLSRYIAVVLSTKSIKAPWVKKELDVAMNREIAGGEVGRPTPALADPYSRSGPRSATSAFLAICLPKGAR